VSTVATLSRVEQVQLAPARSKYHRHVSSPLTTAQLDHLHQTMSSVVQPARCLTKKCDISNFLNEAPVASCFADNGDKYCGRRRGTSVHRPLDFAASHFHTPSAAYDREGSYLVARFFDVYHAVNTLKAFVYQAIYDSLHL